MKLKGKSVVITGASSGMGYAMTKLFVEEGAKVLAVARRQERLDSLKDELKDGNGEIEVLAGDVSKKEDVEKMLDEAVSKFGRLDVLVNNAGVMDDMSPIGEVTDEMYEKVFSINVYGPMCAMRKAVQIFKEQGGGGNIINVASLGAIRTAAGPIYCASKAAVLSMTRNTAYMYNPDKIRVNAIGPGAIKTEISTSMGQPNPGGYERLTKVMATCPEPGEAEDIAKAALFLASDDSSYVNGEFLIVDGGWNAG